MTAPRIETPPRRSWRQLQRDVAALAQAVNALGRMKAVEGEQLDVKWSGQNVLLSVPLLSADVQAQIDALQAEVDAVEADVAAQAEEIEQLAEYQNAVANGGLTFSFYETDSFDDPGFGSYTQVISSFGFVANKTITVWHASTINIIDNPRVSPINGNVQISGYVATMGDPTTPVSGLSLTNEQYFPHTTGTYQERGVFSASITIESPYSLIFVTDKTGASGTPVVL